MTKLELLMLEKEVLNTMWSLVSKNEDDRKALQKGKTTLEYCKSEVWKNLLHETMGMMDEYYVVVKLFEKFEENFVEEETK